MVKKAVVALLAAVALVAIGPGGAATVAVSITKDGFAPADVTVAVGDTVTWTNNDASARQVVANGGAFQSPVLSPGQTFSFTFTSAGRYAYRDAYSRKLRGTVEVTSAGAVTLVAAKPAVLFGASTTLSGEVSTKAAGESVSIVAKPYGAGAFTPLATVTTTTGGAWSLAVKPTIGTAYEARWKSATSAQLTVNVKPRVTLSIRSGVFSTRVAPARPGKTVLFQRWSTTLRQWLTVKRATLTASSTARVRWKPRRGDYKVRFLLPQKQAGPGYLAGQSPARIYVR